MYYGRLKDQLFVDIDYPQEITDLIGDANPWRDFCTLPIEVKNKFQFLDHQDEGDPGYRLRSKSEGREDKEYFHVYPNASGFIEKDNLLPLLKGEPKLQNFFDYSDEVYKVASDFALSIGREMGREIPELEKLIDNGKIRTLLRCLHYTNDENLEVIAEQHFDRSLYTLHLYESDPGLQFLDWNGEWIDAPIKKGKTVVFTGYRGEVLTNEKLQKTWHRVVNKNHQTDRISLVLFVWSKEVEDYPKEARSHELIPSYKKV